MFKAIVLLVFSCVAQSADAAPQFFDAASVKPSPPPGPGWRTVGCKGGPGTTDPGLFNCTEIRLSNLITIAFNLQEYQLSGGYSIGDNTYEIQAKIAPETTQEQFRIMLQNLLIDRFKLVFHYATKQMAVYDLVVAKGGIKMIRSSSDNPAPTAPVSVEPEPPTPAKTILDSDGFPKVAPARRGGISFAVANGRARWATVHTTIQGLAAMLALQLHHPVVDATGIQGEYDFTLSWVVGTNDSASISEGPTLPAAVQQQLGLRLEPRSGPAKIFVIDSVKHPTEN